VQPTSNQQTANIRPVPLVPADQPSDTRRPHYLDVVQGIAIAAETRLGLEDMRAGVLLGLAKRATVGKRLKFLGNETYRLGDDPPFTVTPRHLFPIMA
jgi:hypothetical protein